MTTGSEYKFLIRPNYLPDESNESYFQRLKDENGYETLSCLHMTIYQYLHNINCYDKLNYLESEIAFRTISSLIGKTAGTIYLGSVHYFSTVFDSQQNKPLKFGDLVSKEAIRRHLRPKIRAAFCPECLIERKYFRQIWRPSIIYGCSKHNIYLIQNCKKCNSSLTYEDIVASICPVCKVDLRSFKPERLTNLSIKTTSFLQKLISGNDVLINNKYYSAKIVFRFLEGIMYILEKNDKAKIWLDLYSNSTLPLFERIIICSCILLEDWPQKFHLLLDNFSEISSSFTCNASLGLGHLYSGWIDKRWLSSDFDFIQDAYNEYLVHKLEVLYPGYVKTNRHVVFPDLLEKFPYITEAYAAQLLKTTLQIVRRLIEQGKLRAKKVHGGRAGSYIFRADVESIYEDWQDSVNQTIALQKLGISKAICKALIKSGYLDLVGGRDLSRSLPRLITNKSIKKLKRNITRRTETISHSVENLISFSELMRIIGKWEVDSSWLIEKIITGKIEVWKLSETDKFSIQNLQFKQDAYKTLRKIFLLEIGYYYTYEAAKYLGVKQVVFRRWVKEGIIVPDKKYEKSSVFHHSSLDYFIKRFINTKQCSKILDLTPHTIQKMARQGRLNPICGPGIDGSHSYMFDIDEIKKYKNNTLTSKEMAKKLGISRSHLTSWIKAGKVQPISGPGINKAKYYLFSQ